jgi:hypothetical protein
VNSRAGGLVECRRGDLIQDGLDIQQAAGRRKLDENDIDAGNRK